MIERQLKPRGITDGSVLDAMRAVPREIFVPDAVKTQAYSDNPLPIAAGQTISQPYIVALMTQSLSVQPGDRVLEIGTGTGYQMAVLLQLTPHVFSVERVPELARAAEKKLKTLGHAELHIMIGDGTCGWQEEAPFDAVIITSAAPDLPRPLQKQMAEGGRMVIPVGTRNSQTLYRITKRNGDIHWETLTGCRFVPLIGRHGWNENT